MHSLQESIVECAVVELDGSAQKTHGRRTGGTSALYLFSMVKSPDADRAACCRTMEQAFADLRGLMALAGDMVQLAERFREALAERARAGEGAPEDAMDASMEADLISMGISSPVTKATSGALYHRELSRQVCAPSCATDAFANLQRPGVGQRCSIYSAKKSIYLLSWAGAGKGGCRAYSQRTWVLKSDMKSLTHAAADSAARAPQLADFLTLRIDRAGGMMPLPDVYCLFNRARGSELISPDDLLTAAKLLSATGARLTFRQFASGVLVVQSGAHSDEKVGPMSKLRGHGSVSHAVLQCPNSQDMRRDSLHCHRVSPGLILLACTSSFSIYIIAPVSVST